MRAFAAALALFLSPGPLLGEEEPAAPSPEELVEQMLEMESLGSANGGPPMIFYSWPGREPTPRAFKNIIEAVHRYGIKVIFSEPQFSPRIAEVLAREAGVKVLMLDPIGGRPPYIDNYIAMMQYNVTTMAQAMQ